MVGAASLAMEMSSPALNLHLVYRNLAGEQAQKITAASVKYFALLFFIFRIIIYGSAVVWLCYILATQVCFGLSGPAREPPAYLLPKVAFETDSLCIWHSTSGYAASFELGQNGRIRRALCGRSRVAVKLAQPDLSQGNAQHGQEKEKQGAAESLTVVVKSTAAQESNNMLNICRVTIKINQVLTTRSLSVQKVYSVVSSPPLEASTAPS